MRAHRHRWYPAETRGDDGAVAPGGVVRPGLGLSGPRRFLAMGQCVITRNLNSMRQEAGQSSMASAPATLPSRAEGSLFGPESLHPVVPTSDAAARLQHTGHLVR